MSNSSEDYTQPVPGQIISNEGTPGDVLLGRARLLSDKLVRLLKSHPHLTDHTIPLKKGMWRLTPGRTARARLIYTFYDSEKNRKNIFLDSNGKYWIKKPKREIRPTGDLNDYFERVDLSDFGSDTLGGITRSLRKSTIAIEKQIKQRDKDQVMKQAETPSEDYPVAPTDNIDHT